MSIVDDYMNGNGFMQRYKRKMQSKQRILTPPTSVPRTMSTNYREHTNERYNYLDKVIEERVEVNFSNENFQNWLSQNNVETLEDLRYNKYDYYKRTFIYILISK